MPTLNFKTELTIDDLLTIMTELDDDELAEFEMRFEQLWLSRFAPLDAEAAKIAETHRWPPTEQIRLRALLEKNRERGLTKEEAAELDKQMAKLDEALDKTADDLLKLAQKRRQTTSNESS